MEYPRWKYHPLEKAKLFHSDKEDDSGWFNSQHEADTQPKVGKKPQLEIVSEDATQPKVVKAKKKV